MRVPTDRLFLMLLSACLAVLLWFLVGAEERSEIIVSVPLEYRNLPKGFEISTDGELLTSVNVWVKGNVATIKNLRPHEISAWIDLQNTKTGEKHFELTQDNMTVPYGFSVLRISPSRLNLRIEQVVSRLVSVVPRLEGEPPEGYQVTESLVTPPQVEVSGPQSAVNALRNVITDSIDVSTLTGKHTEKVGLGVENSVVRLANTREVTVSITVSEIYDLVALQRIPIVVTGTKRIVKLNPRWLRIDLMAPKHILSQVSQNQVKAVLDLSGLNQGVYELTPRVVLNPELEKKVSVKAVAPPRVHVRIL